MASFSKHPSHNEKSTLGTQGIQRLLKALLSFWRLTLLEESARVTHDRFPELLLVGKAPLFCYIGCSQFDNLNNNKDELIARAGTIIRSTRQLPRGQTSETYITDLWGAVLYILAFFNPYKTQLSIYILKINEKIVLWNIITKSYQKHVFQVVLPWVTNMALVLPVGPKNGIYGAYFSNQKALSQKKYKGNQILFGEKIDWNAKQDPQ